MNIQVISERYKNSKTSNHNLFVNRFDSFETFEKFDLNVIDMQYEKIWTFYDDSTKFIDIVNDLKCIKEHIATSSNVTTIITLPVNCKFNFSYDKQIQNYESYLFIKDVINDVLNIYRRFIVPFGEDIFLEDTPIINYVKATTKLGQTTFKSDFVFNDYVDYYTALTKADYSNKPTTIKINDNIILTTLDLFNEKIFIDDFFDTIGLIEHNFAEPNWVKQLNYFDDKQQKEKINKNSVKIDKLNAEIAQSNFRLQENSFYKSCLYETGDNLVKVVFCMLEKMLNYDLSKFVDKHQEDFAIKLPTITFIGEIKGVNKNIKSENVSQVDTHLNDYSDKLDDEGLNENLKSLLIMNTFKELPLEERKDVIDKQINLAVRNNTLIILTKDLLKLFEKFENKEVTTEQIIEVFTEEKGLFSLGMIK